MLKKLLCLLLALLLVFSFAACDDNDADDWEDEEEEESEKTDYIPIDPPADFEETTLINDDKILVMVKSIEVQENEWASGDYILNMYLENKTEKEVYFDLAGTIINDFSVPASWGISVPAGKKANEKLRLPMYDMTDQGISEVTKVRLALDCFTEGEEGEIKWEYPDLDLYPLGEDAYTPYRHTPGKNEVLFAEDENVIVRILDVIEDEAGLYSLQVYIYNKSDKTYESFLNSSAFNDFLMGDANYWNTRVYPHSHRICLIHWQAEALEENDIETVEKIWLRFRFSDLNWDLVCEQEGEFAPF